MPSAITNALKRIGANKGDSFGFHGGLKLEPSKRALSSNNGIVEVTPPDNIIIPLLDYYQNKLEPLVNVNQVVKRGQALANALVSPVSGTVTAIEERKIAHPGGLRVTCVVILNDGLDTPATNLYANTPATPQDKLDAFLEHPQHTLEFAGLQGLGGAGFPTATKLSVAIGKLDTLIINAAECEPEIACDEALIQCEPEQIVQSINALIKLTQCQQCFVAIEDSKPQAIQVLKTALAEQHSTAQLKVIPTLYPTGAESPLIQTLTGKFIPHNEKPIDHNIVCINVATAFALWRAINGDALDSRVISLGGAAMPNPCNARVRFGTPVSEVLKQTGNASVISHNRVRVGGPLSGFDLDSLNAPVSAKTNCVLAEAPSTLPSAKSCIRCGQCADVCPANLLPQQLHWYTLADDLEKCEKLNLNACIECGCCDLVCPSSIRLTETFRHAKSTTAHLKLQQLKASEAEQRFYEHEQRVLRREQARQEAIAKRKQNIKKNKTADAGKINAALERARQKRKASKDQ